MSPTSRRLGVAATTLALLLVAGRAQATTPDPRYSTVDAVVVGNSSGLAIGDGPSAGFDVVVRDVNNAPAPGRAVSIDFSATTMKLYAVQNAGTTLDCATRRVIQVTNGAGAAKFALRVSGYSNANAIEVAEDGVMLANVKGRSTDIDGVDGTTGLGDFAAFSLNFLTNQPAPETDFDQNGITGLGDFTIIANEFLRFTPPSAYCP